VNEIQSSHSTPCLELRIATQVMNESSFAMLAAQHHAIGCGEESDVRTENAYYLAWFSPNEDPNQRALITAAAMLLGATTATMQLTMLDDSWETAWQKNWYAQAIGRQLCVRPSFCQALPARKIDIVLEPGMAFGTGMHPTTRLCLEAIEQYCDQTPPATMLDMGAGSGLLAIAALKMGAGKVLAIDYDPYSVAACDDNAIVNKVTFQALLGDIPPADKFELVVANILAKPLLSMAKPLAACTQKRLILSGLLASQQSIIQSNYEAHGLTLIQQWQQHQDGDDWIALAFER